MSDANIKVFLETRTCTCCEDNQYKITFHNELSKRPLIFYCENCQHYFLVWQDSFYDENLRKQYKENKLKCIKCNYDKLNELNINDNFICTKCSSKKYIINNVVDITDLTNELKYI